MIEIFTWVMMLLSFDDWISKHSKTIWDMLYDHWVSANFYVIGNTLESKEKKAIAKWLQEQWHKVCNHTYSHKDLTSLTPIQAYLEVAKGSLAIKRALWKKPDCFRPPFGKTNWAINSFAEALGMSVDWSLAEWVFDTRDWDVDSDPVEVIKNNLTKDHKEILMHDNQDRVVEEVLYILR